VDSRTGSHGEWCAHFVHIDTDFVLFPLVTTFWGHASKACVVKATVGSNPTLAAKYLALPGQMRFRSPTRFGGISSFSGLLWTVQRPLSPHVMSVLPPLWTVV
jgi:hypothetical protein